MTLFDFHFDLGNWALPFWRHKPKTVLIVEDDRNTLHLIRRAAEGEGFDVETCITGEEALGALHRNGKRFVLVLIDVGLPNMGGWELRKQLIGLFPRLVVVVMSGAPESFHEMPAGERLIVMIKPNNYGEFFRDL